MSTPAIEHQLLNRPTLERFQELAQRWRAGQALESSMTRLVTDPAYQQIIGMGAAAVPFLLAELRREPDHWFWALTSITGEDPVPERSRGDLVEMAGAWLRWGGAHGYLPE